MSDLFIDMHERTRNHVATPYNSFTTETSNDVDHHFDNLIDSDDAREAEDKIANILSLKLKKPKHWKWELSTSRSCSNIAMPRILLYDHKGRLLVDANTQDEKVYSEPQRQSVNRKRNRKAATTCLAHSIRQTLNQEFDGLEIQEATPSLLSPIDSIDDTRNSSPVATSTSCIDFFTNDLPDYKFGRHSGSLKGARFKNKTSENSTENPFQFGDLPTPPPSSNTTPTTSSSGPREKRRYRRSQSSGQSPINSPSILERFSFNKGRFSSPEFAEETDVYRPPRYFLRTSKAGTLIVQEESFSRYRRRPRPRRKNSSSERSHSTSSLKKIGSFSSQLDKDLEEAASVEDVSQKRKYRRKRNDPSYRHRSEGNIFLQTISSSSGEEFNNETSQENGSDTANGVHKPQRNYENLKRHIKSDLVTLHPENSLLHPYGSPTER